MTVLAILIVLGLSISFHEVGLYVSAKIFGITVKEFAIGMGPKIFERRRDNEIFTLRAIPLGGFVKLEGEDEDSSDQNAFSNQSPVKRIIVLFSGALMNFVLALLILISVAFYIGAPTNLISDTIKDYPAYEQGIISGDRIIKIGDFNVSDWESVVSSIDFYKGKGEIALLVDRQGETIKINVTPIIDPVSNRALIGIYPGYERSFWGSIKSGTIQTFNVISRMITSLKDISFSSESENRVVGPIGIISVTADAAREGFISILYLTAFISMNLGIINLLPIPALDGSRIVFVLIEMITRKKIPKDKEGMIHFFGFVFLIGLIIFVTFQDLSFWRNQ